MSAIHRTRSPVLYALIGIFAALGFIALSVFNSYETEDRLRSQAMRSAAILSNLRLLEAGLLDAETGQRGFIITSRPAYLEPYEAGRADYRKNIADLLQRLDGFETERQAAALVELRSLADQKLAELAETIRLQETGRRSEALELINTDLGKDLMDSIRALVNELEAEEQLILDGAIDRARAVQTRAGYALAASILLVALLLGLVWRLYLRARKLDRTEELLDEVGRHRDRNALLVQELSHRVKNLFGIVTSIVRMTGRGETDTKVVVQKINQRISSLSRAHALTSTRGVGAQVALADLVDVILEPYTGEKNTFEATGPRVIISDTHLTPLGLILHELVTNAVKYGAWRREGGGGVTVSWTLNPGGETASVSEVRLVWNEPAPSRVQGTAIEPDQTGGASSSGFGTRMMEMSAKQLGGKIDRDWNDGLQVTLTFEIEATE